jgi:hypothetical protein
MLFTPKVMKRLKESAGRTKATWRLTPDECQKLFDEQQGRCYFSGVPLELEVTTKRVPSKKSSGKMHTIYDSKPLTASLDRINPSLGYVRENVRFVHKVVNLMRKDWPEEDFIPWCSLVAQGNVARSLAKRYIPDNFIGYHKGYTGKGRKKVAAGEQAGQEDFTTFEGEVG